MKVMTSGDTEAVITIKNKAEKMEVTGKPVIIATTATSIPTKEILNRFSVIKLDESEEYIKGVAKHICKVGVSGFEKDYSLPLKHFLSELKPYRVSIPFSDKIAEHFPSKHLKENRNISRFLDLIKAVAILHQHNKVKHRYQIIDADLDDYQIARDLFMNLYSGVTEIPLGKIENEIIEAIKEEEDPLNISEIQSRIKTLMTTQGFRPHIEKLVNIEVLDIFPSRNDKNYQEMKYRISEEFTNNKGIKLPHSFELSTLKDKKDKKDKKERKERKERKEGSNK